MTSLPSSAAASGSEAEALRRALFAPRGVALIGSSDDPAKPSARPLRFLRKHGFGGAVYPINPRRDTVLGERAWRDLSEVPGPVDHAFILTGTDMVVDAVEACGRAGVTVATILADGFADAGPEGAARQAALCDRARAHGVRLIGPNSLGVAVPSTGLALTGNAAFEAERLIPGRTALLSQSGSVLGALLSRGQARGLGFSHLVSVGNEADLGVGELGRLLVDDPGVDALVLFLESVRADGGFDALAAAAHAAGKPVIAYKLGRSEAGRGAALTHTGAIVGSDAAVDAFFRRHGILRVDQIETLVELPPLAAGRSLTGISGKAAVVTTTGGGGAMVADRLGLAGVELAGLSEEAHGRLDAQGIVIKAGQIVDVTLAGTRPEIMRAVVEALVAQPDVGIVIAAIGSSAQFHPELAAAALEAFAGAATPVVAFLVPDAPETARMLGAKGVPSFRTPEACADAVAAVLRHRGPVELQPPRALPAVDPGAGARAMVEALGIPVVPELRLAPDAEIPDPLPFAWPVALKLDAAQVAHKTEAGGVALDLADRPALEAARERMARDAAAAGIVNPSMTIQPMVRGLGEVLLGVRADPSVGPVVSVGAGGVLAEVYADVAVELAPVDRALARDMIECVRGLAPLRGHRGGPRGDLDALADAVAAFSTLALACDGRAIEAEINPLIVRAEGEGVVAVDWLRAATDADRDE